MTTSPGSLTDGVLFSGFCGLILHFLFQKFEGTHLRPLKYFALITPVLPSHFLFHRLNSSSGHHQSRFWALLVGYATCYATLLTSIVVYRLSPFHPLARYPGPLLARCSKFWGLYHQARGKNHLKYLEMHRQYGPIVRTGPNELSIVDLDAIPAILGSDGLGKGPIWDVRQLPDSQDQVAHIAMRNTAEHLQRRKPWSKAFATSKIKAFGPLVQNRLLHLVEKLDDKADQKKGFDIGQWMSFFAYDFMGDVAFGAGFELLKHGDAQGLWKMLEDGIVMDALTQHVPWILDFTRSLPDISTAARAAAAKLEHFVVSTATARRQRGSAVMGEDISTYLLDEGSSEPKPLPFCAYANEAMLAVIAGSDTTATTLSCTLYHLICDKAVFSHLRDEVDAAFPIQSGQEPHEDPSKLASMPFLNAVINETLRLYPAVPVWIQRSPEPGTGGKAAGSAYIPEGTSVNVPAYVLHRDSRYFSPDPERYWPERWIASEDNENMKTTRAAFIPFSTGPMNCAGKGLALLELRAVISTLVQRYDMEFDPKANWKVEQWLKDLRDFFVYKKGELPVVLTRREGFA